VIWPLPIRLASAYKRGIRKAFPAARQIADPFHISQQVHKALDQTRRQETKQEPKLKGSRYIWLKHKDEFADLWNKSSVRDAKTFLTQWCERVRNSDVGVIFRDMAANLLKHQDEIINYHRTGRKFSNGICEAINGLVDELKARARGFKNSRYLEYMIYLTQAKLAFQTTHA
jgi:transposase